MPANRCWPFCSEHHALRSALLVPGACLGPFLVVEAGVVEDQGIADTSPISRHGSHGNLYILLVCNLLLLLCGRRSWRRDEPSQVQRYILASVSKFVANVYLRCLRVPVWWASNCNADFYGALGNLFGARGDSCEIPLRCAGGVC